MKLIFATHNKNKLKNNIPSNINDPNDHFPILVNTANDQTINSKSPRKRKRSPKLLKAHTLESLNSMSNPTIESQYTPPFGNDKPDHSPTSSSPSESPTKKRKLEATSSPEDQMRNT